MNYTRIVFSPTGGTARVADILSGVLCKEAKTIDLMKAGNGCTMGKDDICLIAMPVFSGHAPVTAVERLRSVKAEGARAVLVAVYGNRAIDDALAEMEDEAVRCGFQVVAAVKAVAEHSIMRQYGKARPDAGDASELRRFAEAIAEKLQKGDRTPPSLPGNRPYKNPPALPMFPKRTKDCDRCGLCERQCPTGAIALSRGKTVDKSRCVTCMHCVSVCPRKAVRLNPLWVKAVAVAMRKAFAGRKANGLYL